MLDERDCSSWQRLFDATAGVSWKYYNTTAVREDPCSQTHMVFCSNDGLSILELNLGNRGLSGQLPSGLDFPALQYLMLGHNNLTGPVPADLPMPDGCDFKSCCYLNAENRGVYDESKEDGITNRFDCPVPEAAAERCHAVCGDEASAAASAAAEAAKVAGEVSAHRLQRQEGDPPAADEATEKRDDNGDAHDANDDDCQACTPADPSEYPQCDFPSAHVSSAYCTDVDLVIWSQALPDHEVFLEEIPKPPGSGLPEGDFPYPARFWNSQNFAFRIPLVPEYSEAITNYSGAGALAVAINGVPIYPILGPGQTAIDLATVVEDGHDATKNMKLDQQLDHCNIHAGRGMDSHYHGDPLCSYDESSSGHSPIIGFSADGFAVYGKYDNDHALPTDLDRCNGHFEDGIGYHYHSSPTFPYTIVCCKFHKRPKQKRVARLSWLLECAINPHRVPNFHTLLSLSRELYTVSVCPTNSGHGVVDASNMQPGGQPGQYQWTTNNMRPRNDTEKLLPCCSDRSPGPVKARGFVRAARRRQPQWSPQAKWTPPAQVHRQPQDSSSKARAETNASASTTSTPVTTTTTKTTTATTVAADKSEEPAAREGEHAPCEGTSVELSVADCEAWQDLFDGTMGGDSWVECGDKRLDPCSCLTQQGSVVCNEVAGATRITALGLQYNGLNGTVPPSLANLTALAGLSLAMNHHGLPWSGGLGGVLPPLPFEQYTACGLEANRFSCPLPDGAAEACSAGQALVCY